MVENKTKPTQSSVSKTVNAVADESRRADAKKLVRILQEVTGEKPKMWGPSIVGFGTHHYRYKSGREGDTPLAGFSPRKNACVVYGLLGVDGSDKLLARLGRFTTGKGCLYIKKLADVDEQVLRDLIARSVAAKRVR
ncbi:MAG TPA: DUF1801 domain-containing protein [Terracidiphilus sp.]|jgi:hypothetical protein